MYSSVVPLVLLSELSEDIEGQLQLLQKLNQPDEASQTVSGKLQVAEEVKNKEPSRNDFCYQHLKMALCFIPKQKIEECDICIHIFAKMGVL